MLRGIGVLGAALTALLIGASHARAQAVVSTPALFTSTGTFACAVVNLTTTGNIAPTISIVDGATGGVLASDSSAIPPGGEGEVEYTPGAVKRAYCTASFVNNTEADASRVTLMLRTTGTSPGTAYAAIRGVRTGGSSGSLVTTPALSANVDEMVCAAVNTATTAQTITLSLIDETGTVSDSFTVSVPAGQVKLVLLSNSAVVRIRHCEVTAASQNLARQLRVSLFTRTPASDPNDPLDSYAPVEGY